MASGATAALSHLFHAVRGSGFTPPA